MRWVRLCGLAALAAAVGLGGCRRGEEAGPLRVVVSIAPLRGLASELAGPGAEVLVLVPPGRSLHSYELNPSDLAGLGRADVVVYVGLGLDGKVEQFLRSHPSKARQVVSFSRVVGVSLSEGAHAHHHGDDDHDHDHGDSPVDVHLWLDPALVSHLVPAIRGAVEAAQARRGMLTADERARLDAAEAGLLERIKEVDAEYAARLAPLAGQAIVTHHDAFRRIAERYGLRIAAVIRPIESADPTPGAVAAAVRAVREQGARAVFFEPQFDAGAARRIAEASGARLGRLDPEGDTDWFRLMRTNLDSLVTNLSPEGAEAEAR